MSVTSTLLSGIVVWGGIGWLLGRWLGLENLFIPLGMLLGEGVAIYAVYVRYGRDG